MCSYGDRTITTFGSASRPLRAQLTSQKNNWTSAVNVGAFEIRDG